METDKGHVYATRIEITTFCWSPSCTSIHSR